MPAATTGITARPPGGMNPDSPGNGGGPRSKLYHTIMTPINLIAFLVSLYLVDVHYQNERARRHAAGQQHGEQQKWMAWLHNLLFRPQPYEWVDQNKPAPPNKHEERYYYHTKQKKLMKMEAADAFGLRRPVLVGLCSLAVLAAWAAWRLGLGLLYWCRYYLQ
ncbi:hypothetical protein DL767_008470 [Monosporascus sp. MG133]|nr:hypothetical protein DL767_008470 [Monosporascus sp. MG133]